MPLQPFLDENVKKFEFTVVCHISNFLIIKNQEYGYPG